MMMTDMPGGSPFPKMTTGFPNNNGFGRLSNPTCLVDSSFGKTDTRLIDNIDGNYCCCSSSRRLRNFSEVCRGTKRRKKLSKRSSEKGKDSRSIGLRLHGAECSEFIFLLFFSERIRKGGMAEGDAKGDEGRG